MAKKNYKIVLFKIDKKHLFRPGDKDAPVVLNNNFYAPLMSIKNKQSDQGGSS